MKTFKDKVEEVLAKGREAQAIRRHLTNIGAPQEAFNATRQAQAKDLLAAKTPGRRRGDPQVSKLTRENRKLKNKLYTDTLTQIPNRASWEEAHAKHKFPIIVKVDAKHFKRANDTFGHDVGDSILVGAAQAMHAARGGITEPHHIARTGGDEFTAGFMNIQDAHEFARNTDSNVSSLPPVIGPAIAPGPFERVKSKVLGPTIHQHHHALKIGIGRNEEEADRASYEAGKMGSPFTAKGHHKTHIYSLHPESKGPVLQPPKGVDAPTRKSEYHLHVVEEALKKATAIHDSPFETVRVYYMRNDSEPLVAHGPVVQGWLEEPVLENMGELRKSGYYLAFADVNKVWQADFGVAFKL